MRRTPTILVTLCLVVLAACGQTHVPDGDAGVDAGPPPPPCDAPSATILVRTDYVPGAEIVSIVLEVNDVIVDGTGAMEGDDLVTGVELGPVCGLTTGTRITVRFFDARGGEVDAQQIVVSAPEDGATITFQIARRG